MLVEPRYPLAKGKRRIVNPGPANASPIAQWSVNQRRHRQHASARARLRQNLLVVAILQEIVELVRVGVIVRTLEGIGAERAGGAKYVTVPSQGSDLSVGISSRFLRHIVII